MRRLYIGYHAIESPGYLSTINHLTSPQGPTRYKPLHNSHVKPSQWIRRCPLYDSRITREKFNESQRPRLGLIFSLGSLVCSFDYHIVCCNRGRGTQTHVLTQYLFVLFPCFPSDVSLVRVV